jgi:hypothetical protein
MDDSWPVGASADDCVVFLNDVEGYDTALLVRTARYHRIGRTRNELFSGRARIPPNQIF